MTQKTPARRVLEHWSTVDLDSKEAARQATAIILDFEAHPERYTDPEDFIASPFHLVVGLFQQPTVKEATDSLKAEALPVLLRLYDARLREWRKAGPREGYDSDANELLFALKMFAMYQGEEAIQRIIDAARISLGSEDPLWSVILSALVELEPRSAARVADALRESLPPGHIAKALLDKGNTLAREHGVTPHPFDTRQGRELLRAFLTSKNSEHVSYAHSATASLPFLAGSRELLSIAEEHSSVVVRMEAAWAAVRGGDAQALLRLQEWSKDPKIRWRAVEYLKELGGEPARIKEEERPQFDAMAEMSQWLEHPTEFGRAPDRLALYDHRRLFWPPTNDERDVWLFRYRYDGDKPEEGVGMVGSVTFALFSEVTSEMTPEDIYALHCVWELGRGGDAPKEQRVQLGRKLLGFQVY